MKKLLVLIAALFAVSTLSAQTYKVGDLYDVDGKKGVVFEVSEDGQHGTIIALTQPEGLMSWYKAMEYGSQLKDGWYIPSHKELLALFSVREVVDEKLQEVGEKLSYHDWKFYWSTTEFNEKCMWIVCMKTGSTCGSYKKSPFHVRAVSKF
jgi:hypothetical protein